MHSVLRLFRRGVASYHFESFDLGLNFGETPLDKDFGMSTRATSLVPDIKQLFDVTEAESHPLEALDKPEPLGGRLVVEPVARLLRPVGCKRPSRS